MNQFLAFLLFKLNEEIDIVEELILIDNHIMATNFEMIKILTYIKTNINQQKLCDFEVKPNTTVLTEGNPLLILKLLNDFSVQINHLFINHSYVAINKWLIAKCLEFNPNLKINLDIQSSYDDYCQNQSNMLVIGCQDFISEVETAIPSELLKVIAE